MSAWQHLSVSPIAGALGAEVGGIQLAHLNESVFAEIQAAFLEYQVLLFRDQELTRGQQRAFARRFGILNIHPFDQPLKMTAIRNSWYSRATNTTRMSCRRGTPT